jgi:RNA-directed DNA polymerase
VLLLLKAFLKAGILSEEGVNRETIAGTPQGGILTPPAMLQTSLPGCR